MVQKVWTKRHQLSFGSSSHLCSTGVSKKNPIPKSVDFRPSSLAQDLDAVVLALGAGGMKAVLRGSPDVAKVCPNLSSAGANQDIFGRLRDGWMMFNLRLVGVTLPEN